MREGDCVAILFDIENAYIFDSQGLSMTAS